MARVLGISGFLVRSRDPEALTAWYRDVLGLGFDQNGEWAQGAGPGVFAAVAVDSPYFDPRQQTMVTFRVDDLDQLLSQVRDAGGEVLDDRQEADGVGRFGWVLDPDGNRLELWEPPADRG